MMIWHHVSSEMADAETALLPQRQSPGRAYLYLSQTTQMLLCADCASEKLHEQVPLLYAVVAEHTGRSCELCEELI